MARIAINPSFHEVHDCVEVAGDYGEVLAGYLHQKSHKVRVVNPAAVSAFAKSHLSRTKTDKADVIPNRSR